MPEDPDEFRKFIVKAGRESKLTAGTVLAWGVQFPTGRFAVEWRREAYPPEDRSNGRINSLYESREDVILASGGGTIEHVDIGADEFRALSGVWNDLDQLDRRGQEMDPETFDRTIQSAKHSLSDAAPHDFPPGIERQDRDRDPDCPLRALLAGIDWVDLGFIATLVGGALAAIFGE